MDRSTRSSKHKLFEFVPEIAKLERENRKAVKKNLFGDMSVTDGRSTHGGNGSGTKCNIPKSGPGPSDPIRIGRCRGKCFHLITPFPKISFSRSK